MFCDRCLDEVVLNCHECEKLRACDDCYGLIVDQKTYSAVINNYKRNPEDDNGDMLPIYEGKYKEEYNTIDIIEAINIVVSPRILEEKEQQKEKYLITDMKKICNTCGIELNNENKIKDKRVCKKCNNDKRRKARKV